MGKRVQCVATKLQAYIATFLLQTKLELIGIRHAALYRSTNCLET